MSHHRTLIAALFFGLACGAQAQLNDPLETVKNFSKGFGPIDIQATENDGGYATVTRTRGGGDAGADWLIEGKKNIPLDDNHKRLALTPLASVGGGYYVASLLFFDKSGSFIAEKVWIKDTNKPTPQVLGDVTKFASAQGVANAASYRLRIRINPIDQANAGFTFHAIKATAVTVPETQTNNRSTGGALVDTTPIPCSTHTTQEDMR